MPTPKYEQQVASTAQPGVRVSDNAPIEALGGLSAAPAVADFSAHVRQIAAEEKQKADDAATQDAYVRSTAARNKAIYDPKTGVLAYRGKDAGQAPDKVLPAFDSEMEDIQNSLGNEAQRAAFSKIRAQQRQELNSKIASHVYSEAEGVADASFKASVGTAIDDAVLNYRDPGKVAGSKSILRATIMDRAAKLGWDADITRQAVEQAVSQMHKGIVFRELANNKDQAARAWFEKSRGEVTGADATAIEAQLKTGENIGNGARVANDLLHKFSDEAQALEALREGHADKDYYQHARQQLQQGFDDRRLRNHQAYGATLDGALSKFDQGGMPSFYEMGQLSQTDQRMIEKMAGMRAKGQVVHTDDVEFLKLKRMAGADPEKFKRLHLGQYRDCLAPTEFNDLREWQLGLGQQKPETTEAVNGFMSTQQLVKETLSANGIDEKKAGDKDYAQLGIEADRRIAAWKRANQKPDKFEPPQEVVREIVNGMMFKTPAGRWNSKPAWQISPKDIPDAANENISKGFLSKFGRLPTPAERVSIYTAQAQRDANANR